MSVVEIVPGRNEREETVFSVIVKRSYTISKEGTVAESTGMVSGSSPGAIKEPGF